MPINSLAVMIAQRIAAGASAPTVVSRNQGSYSSAATVNLDLPPSIVAGNRLIVVAGWAGSGQDSTTGGSISDWNLVTYVNPGSTIAYRRMKVWEKIADGSEGSTIGLTFSATSAVSAVCWQVSGSSSISFATSNTVALGSTSTSPNPPNLSIGSSAPTLWLAGMVKRDSTAPSAAPSGYSNLLATSTTNMSGGGAEMTSTATSEDPGVFTSTTNDHWTTVTMGIR